MTDVLAVEAGEVISLFAMAEEGPRRRTKGRSTRTVQGSRSDESCSARPVTGRDSKSGSSPGLRPTRNDKSFRAMTPKELGEMAEAEFLARALEMGVAVAKLWGDSRSYDFIVDDEGKLCRVQVKAAFSEGSQGSYSLRAHKHSLESYTEKDIEALAGYVNPVDAWYLFPVGGAEVARLPRRYRRCRSE